MLLLGAGTLLPLIQRSVLIHLERDQRVSQAQRAVTQVIIQLAGIQAKHGQRHGGV